MKQTVEFFSQLATRITHQAIAARSGVTRQTVGKLFNYQAYEPNRRQPATPLVLTALRELAKERVKALRKEADDIERRLPELGQWEQQSKHHV